LRVLAVGVALPQHGTDGAAAFGQAAPVHQDPRQECALVPQDDRLDDDRPLDDRGLPWITATRDREAWRVGASVPAATTPATPSVRLGSLRLHSLRSLRLRLPACATG
jgi:hypothetical protein